MLSQRGDSLANSVQLRALTRGERGMLQAKIKGRRLALRLLTDLPAAGGDASTSGGPRNSSPWGA